MIWHSCDRRCLTCGTLSGLAQEENLRAALLLEQAALCLLRMQPPAVRKFAFHMVLAGLRYNACDQKGLGTRAYKWVALLGSSGFSV